MRGPRLGYQLGSFPGSIPRAPVRDEGGARGGESPYAGSLPTGSARY
jgi:hypothetical protein